jgi:transposase
MTENTTEIAKRLVIGRKRDGRNCYDPEAKRALVEACLQPGVSVARLALQHGVNANLLRIWIGRYRKQQEPERAMPALISAFVPVVAAKTPVLQGQPSLLAMLPNGVRLDLGGIDADTLVAVLNCLSRLPCSALPRD